MSACEFFLNSDTRPQKLVATGGGVEYIQTMTIETNVINLNKYERKLQNIFNRSTWWWIHCPISGRWGMCGISEGEGLERSADIRMMSV